MCFLIISNWRMWQRVEMCGCGGWRGLETELGSSDIGEEREGEEGGEEEERKEEGEEEDEG